MALENSRDQNSSSHNQDKLNGPADVSEGSETL